MEIGLVTILKDFEVIDESGARFKNDLALESLFGDIAGLVEISVGEEAQFVNYVKNEDYEHIQDLLLLENQALIYVISNLTIEVPNERYPMWVDLGNKISVHIEELGDAFDGDVLAD